MSDISQYLPLRGRPPRDESAVTSNWSSHTAGVLSQVGDLLDELSVDQWAATNDRGIKHPELSDVRMIVGEVLWAIRGSRRSRLSAVARRMATDRCLPSTAIAALVHNEATRTPSALITEIKLSAAALRRPGAASTVRDLGWCVAAACEIASVTDHSVVIDPIVSGAVAIAASLSAPVAIRAVLQTCTMRASDSRSAPEAEDGWSIGHGSSTDATASDIILFVYGRRGFPPPAGG